jgi:hypothetical protein
VISQSSAITSKLGRDQAAGLAAPCSVGLETWRAIRSFGMAAD